MRRAIRVAPVALLGLLLGGCGHAVDGVTAPATYSTAAGPGPTSSVVVPPQPQPVRSGSCPFLDSQAVSYDTGQQVVAVRVSDVPGGQTYPMCFFYRSTGQIEVTARVYQGTARIATALVDQAAPIATSNPADQPVGWSGGSLAGQNGAVYAVAKGGTAVIVTSDRMQTIYCRVITTSITQYLANH
jgi:UPF0176 protein